MASDQVSVTNKSKPTDVMKSFSRKVVFTSERALISTILACAVSQVLKTDGDYPDVTPDGTLV